MNSVTKKLHQQRLVKLAAEHGLSQRAATVRLKHPSGATMVARKQGAEISQKPILVKRVCTAEGKPTVDTLLGGVTRIYDANGLIKEIQLGFGKLKMQFETRAGRKQAHKVTIMDGDTELLSSRRVKGFLTITRANAPHKEPRFKETGRTIKAIDTKSKANIEVLPTGAVIIQNPQQQSFVIIDSLGNHRQYANASFEKVTALINNHGEFSLCSQNEKQILLKHGADQIMISREDGGLVVAFTTTPLNGSFFSVPRI